MKRRIHLVDRFLERSWKTYLALRAIEEGALGNNMDKINDALRGGFIGGNPGNQGAKGRTQSGTKGKK